MIPCALSTICATIAEPRKVPRITHNVTTTPRHPIFLNSAQLFPIATPEYARMTVQSAKVLILLVLSYTYCATEPNTGKEMTRAMMLI